MKAQIIQCAQGDVVVQPFRMEAAEDISAHTFTFSVRNAAGTLIFAQLTVGAGIVITEPGSAGTPGLITVTISRANSLLFAEGGEYEYDLWRTNAGAHKQLAFGTIAVAKSLLE